MLSAHFISGASVRPENTVTYSPDNEGPSICGVFSETVPLQISSVASHTYGRPFSCGCAEGLVGGCDLY